MELSIYELKNIVISQNYTKSRKLKTLLDFRGIEEVPPHVYTTVLHELLDGETEDAVLSRFEHEDRVHWIHYYANKVSADLLTLGKIQPETMLELGNLPEQDYEEAVIVATKKANKLNTATIEAERKMNLDIIPKELV